MTCPEGTLSLLDFAEDTLRRRLVDSPLSALAPDEKVADLFCGAGGCGEGARELGIHVDFAVNHDPVAIAAHRANNPACRHRQGDAWRARPRDVIGPRTKLGLLLASAACTTHSRARGSAPISKRVHMLGWCIARWMEDAAPRIVLIENVPEWRDWGPTIEREDGTRVQDPARKGQHFRRWWRYCKSLGYAMEMRVLDAPDYGAASRSRRLFIIARRDGQPIVWPEKTHGKCHIRGVGSQGNCEGGTDGAIHRHIAGIRWDTGRGRVVQEDDSTECASVGCPSRSPGEPFVSDGMGSRRPASLMPYRTAAECIDWSDLGTSIFDRPRPLRPKTLARIVEGVRRFVLNDPQPFVLRVTQSHTRGGGWHVYPADGPMPTQTTRQDLAVATPILAGAGGSAYAAKPSSVADLLNTVKCDNRQALVSALLMNNTTHHTGGRVDGLVPTVTTGGQAGLVAPVMAYLNHGGKQTGRADEPLRTVVGGGNHAMLVAALMMEYYGNSTTCRRPDGSLGAVTTLDRHGLVCCLIDGQEFVVIDILFRMLRPRELAKAMGFRDDYAWPKTQRDTVRLIGNAVSPPQALALVASVLPNGRRGEQGERRAAS